MPPVAVRILHPEPDPASGPLTRWVADARATLAEHHRRGFVAAGADDVAIVGGPPDDRSVRRSPARARRPTSGRAGWSCSVRGRSRWPRPSDRQALVAVAAGRGAPGAREQPLFGGRGGDRAGRDPARRSRTCRATTRCRAGSRRWPATRSTTCAGAGGSRSTSMDRSTSSSSAPVAAGRRRRPRRCSSRGSTALRAVAADPRAELLVAGRTSSANAGLARAAHRGADPGVGRGARPSRGIAPGAGRGDRRRRPTAARIDPRRSSSTATGPGRSATISPGSPTRRSSTRRVLLAHRVGAEEAGWPAAEDRFASDLLLAERIADPWLRELTASAAAAPIPVLLGGHTLVGPGVRLVVGGTPGRAPWR